MNSKCGVQSKKNCESRESCVCTAGFSGLSFFGGMRGGGRGSENCQYIGISSSFLHSCFLITEVMHTFQEK